MNSKLHSQTRTFNVDSPIILDDGFVALAERVLTLSQFPVFSSGFLKEAGVDPGQFSLRTPLSPVRSDFYEGLDDIRQAGRYMFILLHSIPVYLREAPPGEPVGVTGDVLGLYSGSKGTGPSITLFPERILEEGKSECVLLAAKVLVHELAHALMDPCNYAGLDDKYSTAYRGYVREFMNERTVSSAGIGRQNTFPMNFYHVREESFANVITLRLFLLARELGVIKAADFNFVRRFMETQPVPYCLAPDILPSSGFGQWMKAKAGDGGNGPHSHGPITEETAFKWMEDMEQYLASGARNWRLRRFADSFGRPDVLPWQRAVAENAAGPGADRAGGCTLLGPYHDSIWDITYDDLRSLGAPDRFAAKTNGRWILLEGSHQARPAVLSKSPFDEYLEGDGVLFIRIGGRWSVMDIHSGERLRNLAADRVEFHGDYAIIHRGHLYGTLRLDGTTLEPPVYASIVACWTDGDAVCTLPDGMQGMLLHGKASLPCEYGHITDHGMFYSASKDGKQVLFRDVTGRGFKFFSKDGAPVLFDSLVFNGRVIIYRKDGLYGFIGSSLNQLCSPMFEEVGGDVDGVFPLRQNGRWGLFEVHDKNMRKVHACEFVTLEYSSGAWFGETSKGNRWRIDPKFPSQNKKL